MPTGAWAQNIYKCGNSYSQQPCAGGSVVDTADSRSGAQKQAAEQASQRTAQAAAALEKARLQKDKADLQAPTPTAKPTVKPAVKPDKPQAAAASQPKDSQPAQKTAKKPRLSGANEFKAQVPGEPGTQDKKKTAKKTAATD
jgi:type II secretory pathway pseudopilin PulG